MLKSKNKKSTTVKTKEKKKSKELSEKTMGKIVGGVNGFDEIEVDEDEFIADKVVESQAAIMSSYTVYRNKKNIESDKIIAPRKKREEHIEPIINVKKIYKKRGKKR